MKKIFFVVFLVALSLLVKADEHKYSTFVAYNIINSFKYFYPSSCLLGEKYFNNFIDLEGKITGYNSFYLYSNETINLCIRNKINIINFNFLYLKVVFGFNFLVVPSIGMASGLDTGGEIKIKIGSDMIVSIPVIFCFYSDGRLFDSQIKFSYYFLENYFVSCGIMVWGFNGDNLLKGFMGGGVKL